MAGKTEVECYEGILPSIQSVQVGLFIDMTSYRNDGRKSCIFSRWGLIIVISSSLVFIVIWLRRRPAMRCTVKVLFTHKTSYLRGDDNY